MDPDSVDGVDRVPHGGRPDPEILDFSANTNPERPAGIEAVLEESLEAARAYPPEPPVEYREAAGQYLEVPPEQVIPTPGGLAAIRLALEVTVEAGDSVLVPFPSFGEYEREVSLQGATPEPVPYDELLEADLQAHAAAIVCNPNNPTGDAYDAERLREFAQRARAADTVLIADEAFLGFTTEPTLAGTEGVVVARSLTKLFGLPGLRAGFAVATGSPRDRLDTARRTWNLDVPAMRAGVYSMGATDFVEATRERVDAERGRMGEALGDRYDVHPSVSPFLLLEVVDEPVDAVLDRAAAAGIAIRDARSFRGLDAHVRVAVRRPEENRRLEEVLLDG